LTVIDFRAGKALDAEDTRHARRPPFSSRFSGDES
jgi:hypothetical protein